MPAALRWESEGGARQWESGSDLRRWGSGSALQPAPPPYAPAFGLRPSRAKPAPPPYAPAFGLHPSRAKPAPPPYAPAFGLRPSRAKPAPPPYAPAFGLRPSRAKPAPPPYAPAFGLRPSRAKPAPPGSRRRLRLHGGAVRRVALARVGVPQRHRAGGGGGTLRLGAARGSRGPGTAQRERGADPFGRAPRRPQRPERDQRRGRARFPPRCGRDPPRRRAGGKRLVRGPRHVRRGLPGRGRRARDGGESPGRAAAARQSGVAGADDPVRDRESHAAVAGSARGRAEREGLLGRSRRRRRLGRFGEASDAPRGLRLVDDALRRRLRDGADRGDELRLGPPGVTGSERLAELAHLRPHGGGDALVASAMLVRLPILLLRRLRVGHSETSFRGRRA